MSSTSQFYLPVILPPSKDARNPPAYYSSIKKMGDTGVEVTADPGETDGSLEITITNSNLKHPSEQFPNPRPLSSVFAPTSGFARFYPSSVALPTPDGQPIAPPPGVTEDLGSILIRVWISDFLNLIKTPSTSTPRINRIVIGWLQPSEVRAAFAAEIEKLAKLSDKILQRAWNGATGPVPDDKDILKKAFLERFMKGDAEIFVSAGTEIGSAAQLAGAVAKVKLQTFFQPASQPPADQAISVDADDLIDNAAAKSLFTEHPLVEASNGPITVKFKSQFTIWNDQSRSYEALANTLVTLMKDPADNITVDAKSTGADGRYMGDLEASLMKRDLIFFSYDTTGKTFGSHEFDRDIETEPHLARLYLNGNHENTRVYRASEEVYPQYRDFIDALADNQDNEVYERDRGNGDVWDKSTMAVNYRYAFTFASQKGFLMRIRDSEKRYKDSSALPSNRFTLLLEGDSWLSYPPDGHGSVVQYSGDIYGQLDGLLSNQVEDPKLATYIRFPLQHHGDRIDQMFGGDSDDATRQWQFTREFLREYRIDAIVCSAGGNDFAEPAISHWLLKPDKLKDSPEIAKQLAKCFTDPTFDQTGSRGYFDPTRMSIQNLSADFQQEALRLMEKSFAILLNDHPWNQFVRSFQKPDLKWENLPGWKNLGPETQPVFEIGRKVVENIPEFTNYPDPDGGLPEQLLATVFDADRYRTRFEEVTNNWKIFLTAVKELQPGTPVFTHTYSYPFFSQEGTWVRKNKWLTGPWFKPRFEQAKISDYRIRFICLKAMLDNYKSCVLDVLKDSDEFQGMFNYVDVRADFKAPKWWADEMHLHSDGFEVIGAKLYNEIAKKYGYPLAAVPPTE